MIHSCGAATAAPQGSVSIQSHPQARPCTGRNPPGFHRFRRTFMSAHNVYDKAPLGSLIRYSDGTPKPRARFNKKLAAWQNRNGVARLVKKEPQRDRPTYTSPASITLHEGDFASGGVVLVKVLRTHSVASDLRFEIIERPLVGAVRILQDARRHRRTASSSRKPRRCRTLVGTASLFQRAPRRRHRG
jgi:hypothetical protein